MIKLVKSSTAKMGVLSVMVLLFLYSCEIEKIEPANPTPETEEPLPADTTSEKPGQDNQSKDALIIGNGSGELQIMNVDGKHYSIAPGTYSGIYFENVKNTTVDGLGKVTISNGEMSFLHVNHLTVSGITIKDYQQTVINIWDDANNLTLKDFRFENIQNTVIALKKNDKYDGTPKSFSENIHLVNIHAENIGTLFGSSGGMKSDGFYGLIKGFKLTGSTIINSPELSNGIFLNIAEDYEISNNIVKNVNSNDDRHNGIFHVIGNGKIFGNKATDHQGNLVRAWLLSVTRPNSFVEIYDNKVYNSRKYSAFELQVTPWMYEMSNFKPANAKVYNNTIGMLDTEKAWVGRLLDLYNISGTLEIYNNLSFANNDEYLINNMSETKIIRNENNKYFQNASDALYDLINFKSKIPGIGAR